MEVGVPEIIALAKMEKVSYIDVPLGTIAKDAETGDIFFLRLRNMEKNM